MKNWLILLLISSITLTFVSCTKEKELPKKEEIEEWHTTGLAKTKSYDGRVAISDDRFWPVKDYYEHPETGVRISFADVPNEDHANQIAAKIDEGKRALCTIIFKTKKTTEYWSDGYQSYQNIKYELISARVAEVLN